jgi:serine/threonine-protein phosphatase 6 regulatory ankyrin repeat subunit A
MEKAARNMIRAVIMWALPQILVLSGCAGNIVSPSQDAKKESTPVAVQADKPKMDPSSLLQIAAIGDPLLMVKRLIEQGADPNTKFYNGGTALHTAAANGAFEIVDFLVSKGVDVNAKDIFGYTPLHWAAEYGRYFVVDFLLKHGAEVNPNNKSGRTPLDLAVAKQRAVSRYDARQSGGYRRNKPIEDFRDGKPVRVVVFDRPFYKEAIELLRERGGVTTWLEPEKVIADSTPADVGRLLKSPDDFCANDDLWHVICALCRRAENDPAAIDSLINSVQDLNVQFGVGPTLLVVAVEEELPKLTKALIEKGARTDITYSSGPLIGQPWDNAVILGGSAEIVQTFIDHGADVNKPGPYDSLPLQWAAFNRHYEVAKVLIANGAKVNAVDRNGNTALHTAVDRGSRDIVELLLSHGADINVLDKDNKTPLDLVALKDDDHIRELLLQHGAKTAQQLLEEKKQP